MNPPTSNRAAQKKDRLIYLLAALTAIGPLTIDMYLPAMPDMRDAMLTDTAHMHLTVSGYLWGFALFHLLCGPLADRYGRKPIILGGTGVFIAASLGCAATTSIEMLIAMRFIQGAGACVGPTLARTVARDLFGPRDAARALSLIAMFMALAPAIAPGLGGIMLTVLPWPSIFLFLAVYGGALFLLVTLGLPETLPSPQSLRPSQVLRAYRAVALEPQFLIVVVAGALVYAGLIAYLASTGFIFIEMLGVPRSLFGLLFLTSVIGYMGGSALSARLTRFLTSERMLLLGTALAALSTVVMLVAQQRWPQSALAIALPMTGYATALGLSFPHSIAIALRPFPHIAGTAASLQGFLQMAISSVVAAYSGKWLGDDPANLVHVMLAVALLALVLGIGIFMTSPGRHDELQTPPPEES